MSERIDRLETALERNIADVADLIVVSGNVLMAVESIVEQLHRYDEEARKRDEEARKRDEEARRRDERFEILRQEAIADRKNSDAKFNALLLEIQSTNRRVDVLEQSEYGQNP